jgi:hypothetical protein
MAYIKVDGDVRWVPDKKGQLIRRLTEWGIAEIDGQPIRKAPQFQLYRRCCAETRRRTRQRNLVVHITHYQLPLFQDVPEVR